MDTREDVNRVLAQMGEPPLGPQDVVQTQFVESADQVAELADGDEKLITLVEPPGYKRSHLFFMNGRQVDLDLTLAELVAEVRAFNADPSRDYLELPHIEAVGEEAKGNVVVVANPTYFTHRALELLQSMGTSWMKRVPGEERKPAAGKVAVVRGDDAKSVILSMNREQRRRLGRENGHG